MRIRGFAEGSQNNINKDSGVSVRARENEGHGLDREGTQTTEKKTCIVRAC